jgi:hypothetical protein
MKQKHTGTLSKNMNNVLRKFEMTFEDWFADVEDGEKLPRKEIVLDDFLDGKYEDYGYLMMLLEQVFVAGKIAGIAQAWEDDFTDD